MFAPLAPVLRGDRFSRFSPASRVRGCRNRRASSGIACCLDDPQPTPLRCRGNEIGPSRRYRGCGSDRSCTPWHCRRRSFERHGAHPGRPVMVYCAAAAGRIPPRSISKRIGPVDPESIVIRRVEVRGTVRSRGTARVDVPTSFQLKTGRLESICRVASRTPPQSQRRHNDWMKTH